MRAENRSLKAQIERMSLEQVRMSEDADQAAFAGVAGFQGTVYFETMAAQVIGRKWQRAVMLRLHRQGHNDGISPTWR